MRRIAVLCGIVFFVCACVSRPAAVERKGRVIALTDSLLECGGRDTVRLGRLHSGEIAVSRLWIANRVSRPVVISSFDRSCGCVDFAFEESPLLPGEIREFSLSFDSRGSQGWQFKNLNLHFSDSSRPLRLFIDVEVE